MKIASTFLLSLLLVGACSSGGKKELTSEERSQQLKQQRAESVATSMLNAIDNRDWKEFEKSFASRTVVIMDEPLLLSPSEITKKTRPSMEYFSSTKHSLSDFKLEEKNERMLGTAKLNANYWKNRTISSDVATIKGKYEFEFVQSGEELKIMRMRFLRKDVDGADEIIEKASKKIQSQDAYRVEIVDIPSRNGKLMRGWLYLPQGKLRDVIVINGNIANVKEQGSLVYGRELAGNGFATLVFDYVNFGESDGDVRNLEDPAQKIDDFRGAVDFVANRKEFTEAKITLLGLGNGAGYAASEAVKDPRVDRLIMIAPWLQNQEIVQTSEMDLQKKMKLGREASHQFVQDGVLTYVPVVSLEDKSAVITSDSRLELDYYLKTDRGDIPQWRNQFATMGWTQWLNFESTAASRQLKIPTLIFRARGGKHTAGLQEFVAKMRFRPEIHSLAVQPYDFYDRPIVVNETVRIIENFLIPAKREQGVTSL